MAPTCTAEDALCNRDANGSVSVSVDGGTEPYSYSWSNGGSTASQTGLTAGTYVVTITDENGCTTTCNSLVGEPDVLTAVVDVQDETLVNGCNGSATANPTGGTPPYSYEWSNGGTTQTITDLCAGTYTVIVTDANECEFITSNIVNPPSCDLDVDMASTDVSCNAGVDGTATATPITVQNNTPFTYEWNNGATTQTLSGVTAGPYSVVVTDSIGCEASGSVVISEPTALTVSTVVVDEQNFGACDDSATATAGGGTPPYSYEWSDGQTTAEATGLCPDTYTVTVTDSNGCEETVTITVNPLLCTGFAVAINTESLSCFEAGDGSATAIVSGGTAPFTYSWDNGGTTDIITGLDAGQYTVTVVDAVGCTQTVSGNVTQPALLEAAIAVDNVSCHGVANGVVELTVTGGTAPFDFDWDNGATTEDLNNVGPSSYNVLVTDENGCTVTASADVTEPDTLQVSSIDVDPTCFEGNDGSIDLTISGGLGPYLVAWDNQANTEDISGLEAGTYVATIVDQNGCIYTYTTTLTDPPLVVPTISANGPTIFCEGDSVTLTASTAAGYTWSPNGETTQSITVYDAGDYSVSVVTEDGCEGTSASTTVSIFLVDPANITADGPTEFCDGNQVDLTASLGSSYSWMPNGETTQTITVSQSGTYTVTVTDENGCESSSADVTVVVFDEPTPTITTDGPLTFCEGGSVTLTSSAGDSYFWTPNGETSQSITATESGIYRVTITDENGCEGRSTTVEVIVNDNPTPIITADGPIEFCEGGSVTLNGPTGFTIYEWSPNGETSSSTTATESGDYQLTVTDEFGCIGESNIISVIEFDVDTATVTVNGATEFCDGDEVVLTASTGDSYVWSPNGETTQSITVSQSDTYAVSVTDQNGCESTSDAIVVTVNPNPEPIVTPSGPTEFCEGDSVILSATAGFDSYLWTPNGETTSTITVMSTGTWSVIVIDENGCEGTSDPINTTFFEVEPVSINSDGPVQFCDGDEVVLTASSGSTFEWSPNGEVTPSITVTESGEYSVVATDQNGCSVDSDTITVDVIELPEATITVSGPIEFCEGDSVTLVASDGIAFLWSPNGETTQDITVYESGIYSVELADSTTCVAYSDSIEVTVFEVEPVAVTASGSIEFCDGGEVTLTSSNSDSYEWYPNGEITQSITVSESGQYVVTAEDANGCSTSSDTVDVVVFELPEVSASILGADTLCEDETVDLLAITTDSVMYQWLENGTPIIGAIDSLINVDNESIYTIVVTDENGCMAEADAPVLSIGEIPMAMIVGDSALCAGDSILLIASGGDFFEWSTGSTESSIYVNPDSLTTYSVTATNVYCWQSDIATTDVAIFPTAVPVLQTEYNAILEVEHLFEEIGADSSSIINWSWDFGDGMFGEDQLTDHTYSDEGIFTVSVLVENEFGCFSSDTAMVEVTQIIDIPNVFTPNDDGYNDNLYFDNFGVDSYELTIYNRWGIIVHYDRSGEIFWDGRTPAGAECEAGTYFYTLNVLNEFSVGDFKQSGYVTLIR